MGGKKINCKLKCRPRPKDPAHSRSRPKNVSGTSTLRCTPRPRDLILEPQILTRQGSKRPTRSTCPHIREFVNHSHKHRVRLSKEIGTNFTSGKADRKIQGSHSDDNESGRRKPENVQNISIQSIKNEGGQGSDESKEKTLNVQTTENKNVTEDNGEQSTDAISTQPKKAEKIVGIYEDEVKLSKEIGTNSTSSKAHIKIQGSHSDDEESGRRKPENVQNISIQSIKNEDGQRSDESIEKTLKVQMTENRNVTEENGEQSTDARLTQLKKAEKIVGIYEDDRHILHFFVKYEGDEELERVPAAEANVRWPQIVIKYYEDHCFFEDS